MSKAQQTTIQEKLFDFALMELVRTHRSTFQPLWSIDSWVKFLIWLTLNCGLSGDRENLELFADALSADTTRRMRKVFFERNVEKYSLCLMADPADPHVLLMPIDKREEITFEKALKALETVGLIEYVVLNQATWNLHSGIITISWKSAETDS